jgi:Vitamin K-dependent gamma-carboxylase
MSTMPTPTSGPNTATPPSRPWWRSWSDFWFRAADPTTLAFMRICTGLLVLYIHLAYSVDLQAFFGKHGWYAANFIDRERHESPVFVSPTDWETFVVPRLSEVPHRRAAFMQFLRALPEDKAEFNAALAYLIRANNLANDDDFRSSLLYVQRMKTRTDRDDYLTAMSGGKVEITPSGSPTKVDITPSFTKSTEFIAALPPEEKAKLAGEIRAFWDIFAKVKWTDSERGRDYVFNYFIELPGEARRELIRYTESLGEVTLDERKKLLDYMEYWNNDPRKAFRQGSAIFSVWFHVTDPTQMALVHTGIIFLIFLFTIGLFTRVTSVLVWLAVLSYIHRTQQVLFGMDTMMNILLFYLMIGNCGAALSVDRLIARYRAARASLRRSGTIDPNTRAFLAYPQPSVSAGFTMRLIQVHFCFIYMAAGLAKLKGGTWWTGDAFWGVVANPEFTLMSYSWYEETLRLLATSKPVYEFMIWSGTVFTLFVEIGLPFLVWTRLRWVMILLAVVMHAIIAVLMGLNLFELLMIVMLLAYLPDRVIRDRFRGGPDLPKFAFTFNPGNEKHARAAALAQALDSENQITATPDASATETTAVAFGGKPSPNGEGATALFRGLRLLGVLGLLLWIPGVKRLLSRRLFPSVTQPVAAVGAKPPTPAAR